MKPAWPMAAKILTGIFVTAAYAFPQAYTISAKPGVVNYFEGNVELNGKTLSNAALKTTFLNANDTLSTGTGKAEVLLAPGIFLRLGENAAVKMISPSLANTQIELKQGEAMVEADNIVKDSQVTVLAGGGSMLIDRNGLYRIRAGEPAIASVLEGKAQIVNGERKLEIGKGKEVVLGEMAKVQKFNTKQQDDLYAWSTVRAAYDAAGSYQAARDLNAASYGGVWGGYGFSGFSNPGWMWNAGFNTWSWIPGDGAFYSPFGYGFYGPGVVTYAPVVYAPVYGGGGGGGVIAKGKAPVGGGGGHAITRPVPVNPVKPAAFGGTIARSPAASQAMRASAMRSYNANGGFRSASGARIPVGRAAAMSAAPAARASGGYQGGARGGYAGGAARGGYSGMSASAAGASRGSAAPAAAPAAPSRR